MWRENSSVPSESLDLLSSLKLLSSIANVLLVLPQGKHVNQFSDVYLNLVTVPCFYRGVETLEVVLGERRRLFSSSPKLSECFYNLIETRRTCFLFLLGNNATKKGKHVNFNCQNVNSLWSRCHYVHQVKQSCSY